MHRYPALLAACLLTACASDAPQRRPLTAESVDMRAALEDYRMCAWGHFEPLRVTSRNDSAVSIATVAEAQCGLELGAVRHALMVENGQHPRAATYAGSFIAATRKIIINRMAADMLRSK